jgi:hypothetical protein
MQIIRQMPDEGGYCMFSDTNMVVLLTNLTDGKLVTSLAKINYYEYAPAK